MENKQLHTHPILLQDNEPCETKGNCDNFIYGCVGEERVYTCCGSICTLNSVGVNDEIPQTHLLSSSNSDRTEHDCEWILIVPEL